MHYVVRPRDDDDQPSVLGVWDTLSEAKRQAEQAMNIDGWLSFIVEVWVGDVYLGMWKSYMDDDDDDPEATGWVYYWVYQNHREESL
jgi:hypothetical protein